MNTVAGFPLSLSLVSIVMSNSLSGVSEPVVGVTVQLLPLNSSSLIATPVEDTILLLCNFCDVAICS